MRNDQGHFQKDEMPKKVGAQKNVSGFQYKKLASNGDTSKKRIAHLFLHGMIYILYIIILFNLFQ